MTEVPVSRFEGAPLVLTDARNQASVKNTLIRLVESIAADGEDLAPAQGRRIVAGR
jgi:hypothetical protein